MRLETVSTRGRAPVIAHGGWQEVVLDVGVLHAWRRTHEGGRLEMVGRAEPALEQQPARPDQRLGERVQHRVKGDRLDRFLLDVEFEVVLQIAADAGPVGDDRDAFRAQLLRRPDAGEQQELGRVDGRGGDDDLTFRLNELNRPATASRFG